MKSTPARLLAALLLVGLGFGYGFLVAKRKLFPYSLLRRLAGNVAPTVPAKSDMDGPMKTGWWVPTGDGSEEDVTANLSALGYSQSYGGDREEFGVTTYDEARVIPGRNLVVSAHEPTVLLTDMHGNELHRWHFEFKDVPTSPDFTPDGSFGTRYFRRAKLLPDGGLLAIFDRTAILRLDADSNLIWSLLGGYHHDLEVTEDGTIWTLRHDVHIVPRIHPTIPIFEDFVTRISPDGEVLSESSLLEAVEHSPYASLLETLDPEKNPDLFHTNTIEVFDGHLASLSPLFAKDNVLVSFWGLDTIAIVGPPAGGGALEVLFALTGMWHRPHQPTLLEDGRMLVFDNMAPDGFSRVIEVDPFTQAIHWEFDGDAENGFRSELCGSNQRLANGNTLITESLSGRAFEVAPDGTVVWRYLSPFRVELPGSGAKGVAVLMEVVRLPLDTGDDWLER